MDKAKREAGHLCAATGVGLNIQCGRCHDLPVHVVETTCCGALYCWECLLASQTCVCGGSISPEACREAKAIENLLAAARQQVAPVTVACPEGCKERLSPADIEDHLRSWCPNVEVSCECMMKLKRGELLPHTMSDCPLAIMACPYGCDDVLMRREMEEHMRENRDAHMENLLDTLKDHASYINNLTAAYRQQVTTAKPRIIWYLIAMCICVLVWPSETILVGLLYALFDRYAKARAAQATSKNPLIELLLSQQCAGTKPRPHSKKESSKRPQKVIETFL